MIVLRNAELAPATGAICFDLIVNFFQKYYQPSSCTVFLSFLFSMNDEQFWRTDSHSSFRLSFFVINQQSTSQEVGEKWQPIILIDCIQIHNDSKDIIARVVARAATSLSKTEEKVGLGSDRISIVADRQKISLFQIVIHIFQQTEKVEIEQHSNFLKSFYYYK